MKIKGNLSLFAKPHDSVDISPSAEFREVVVSQVLVQVSLHNNCEDTVEFLILMRLILVEMKGAACTIFFQSLVFMLT